jgi:hypothetical protein
MEKGLGFLVRHGAFAGDAIGAARTPALDQ